ncbi:MAG: phosphoenolpyruvate--protein phosphotransferase [Gammaproteobacteria bacterium]
MLNQLRRIIQEVNSARNLDQALSIIVQRVKETMAVDVCSVYLNAEEEQQLVLMATEGLRQEAVGQIRLSAGEGLVSLVAERAEPVNLAQAPEHPQYRYFPESGEEQFSGFLGVPIIHHRSVLGVLIVQQRRAEEFDEDHVTLLITIAAQLAGAIAHADASGEIDRLLVAHDDALPSKPIKGQPGAPGVGLGTAVVIYPQADLDATPDRVAENIDEEIENFRKAVNAVKAEIQVLSSRLKEVLPQEDNALFDAYLLMLESKSLNDVTIERIRAGQWAQGALRQTVTEQLQVFHDMDDPYLRERGDDLHDLSLRILVHLQEASVSISEYPENTVLMGHEISASMLAEVPQDKLRAVVSIRGSRTSHVAILARALGIPAVMGAKDLPVGRVDRQHVIVDGYGGQVYIAPSRTIQTEYLRLAREEEDLKTELMTLKNLPAETQDGELISLYANTGLLSDITPSLNSGAEGIGLYRTEFPFMIRQRFPGEDEQYNIYRQVLEAFAPRPVTLRTLDIGGDKALPYFPIEEDNPFLGWRGIRITLDHPEIFLVQVRAMIRANAGLENLQILLPMISDVSELDEAQTLIQRAHSEIREEGLDVSMPKIGVMIEVPSAVYLMDVLARRVDFFSIGTNDLTQYLLAVDRNNAQVADLYDSLHPAVLRAVQQVIERAHAHHKPVSVCGEMAGDPAATILLVAMGVDSLSMSASSLLRVKWVIRNLTRARSREVLQDVLGMESAKSIRKYLSDRLDQAGLGGLIRAGR